MVVVDGPILSYEGKSIPTAEVVPLLNAIMKQRKVSHIGVYVRAGSKYGEVMRAVDLLRRTDAKDIRICDREIRDGREP